MDKSLLIAEVIVTLSTILTMITGFGFVVFSAPLLSFLYNPTSVVVNALLMGTIAIGMLLLKPEIRKGINSRLAFTLTLWSAFGIPIGVMILPWIDQSLFRKLLGFLSIVYGVINLMGLRILISPTKSRVFIFGILGGIFGSSTGLSSLPIIWFLGGNDLSPKQFRSTIAIYVFLNGIMTLIGFTLSDLISPLNFQEVVLFSPSILIGILIGFRLNKTLSQNQLETGSLFYLLLIGIMALIF